MAKQVEKPEWARIAEAFEASGQTQREFVLAHGVQLSTLQEYADKIPGNSFPGFNVFINGKHYDALVLSRRTLWEVKTDDFEKHSPRSRNFFVSMKLPELQREAKLARECGYDFAIGVRSEAHRTALKIADPSLHVVIMDWC
ncbi:DUF6310 domain-containing protein [Corallococcus exiguus]|uniref:DUF6310 domain-containing protein n=1 Tax=Corallococcus exiguus TaxID=83462 RepID=UPI0020B8691A|nr:DUF6310 domain-containing protein [Corallococcus exiguus]